MELLSGEDAWDLRQIRCHFAERTASATAPPPSAETEVTERQFDDVKPVLEQARRRWLNAGYSGRALDDVQIRITDLSGSTLGFGGAGIVCLDSTAAGAGLYIDTISENDEEFLAAGPPASNALSGIDLLTVLSHEIRHLIGLSDESSQDQPEYGNEFAQIVVSDESAEACITSS